ncbi:MAG: flavodoxin [Eubacterium sp.]|nr:flavodoxin [Eubacterium sp.]
MKIAVRYYTKSGNSKKLADAIAEELGVKALSVEQKLTEDADLLFLCNSVYCAGVDGNVKRFLKAPRAKIGRLVNVSTAAILESTYSQIKKLAANEGVKVADKEFHCKGSFTVMHRGKPDAEDIKCVKKFASEIAKGE